MRWIDWLGIFWASWWFLIIGCFLILGSVVLKWIAAPFSNNLTGLDLSLLHSTGAIPHFSLASFGALGVFVLLIGLLSFRWYPPALSLVGAILITLWIIAPAHIAFRQPSMLRRLTDELQVASVNNIFTKEYLTQNYGPSEMLPKQLVLYTAWGRLRAAWSFLRLGWYCFGLGSIMLFVSGFRWLPGLGTRLLLICLPVTALAIVLTPAAIGQHYFSSGSIAKARGHDQEAISCYRKAMTWDPWHADSIELYATIGELQKIAGIASNSPERHICRGLNLVKDRRFEAAVFEFREAAEAGGPLGLAAEGEASQTLITFGLALYNDGGIGGAVSSWEQALIADPSQLYVLFFLARSYYDLGRYDAALQATSRLAGVVADHTSMLGNVYSLAGDCSAKLGKITQARHYYNLSLAADSVENYWALTGLIGQ